MYSKNKKSGFKMKKCNHKGYLIDYILNKNYYFCINCYDKIPKL
jgi:hypothetical protein